MVDISNHKQGFTSTPLREPGVGVSSAKAERGFTLIETLLYLAVAGSILLVIAAFLAALLQTRVKHQTITEVQQQGMFAMRRIAQNIKKAEAINSPAQGETSSELSLSLSDPENNPTVFNLDNGTLTESLGGQGLVDLTAPNISVTELRFTNVSQGSSALAVKIEMLLSYKGLSGRNEYDYQTWFYDTASLRK